MQQMSDEDAKRVFRKFIVLLSNQAVMVSYDEGDYIDFDEKGYVFDSYDLRTGKSVDE